MDIKKDKYGPEGRQEIDLKNVAEANVTIVMYYAEEDNLVVEEDAL